MVLSPPHGVTWMDEGVAAHMRGGKGFSYNVGDPIMYIVMISLYEDALLAIQIMTDVECCIASITVGRDVWEIYSVEYQEGILPFLRPQLSPVYFWGATVINDPIFFPCIRRQASMARAAEMTSSSTACTCCTFRRRIFPYISLRSRAWSLVFKYILPQRDVTRWPVTTQESIQLYEDYRVRLVIASPA